MSGISIKAQFKLEETGTIIEKRGLSEGGRVQQMLDSEILKYCAKYVPFDTGSLHDSGILSTQIGSGVIRYNSPYARYQYYGVSKNGKRLKYNKHGGPRGRYWIHRAVTNHKGQLLNLIARASGGTVKE